MLRVRALGAPTPPECHPLALQTARYGRRARNDPADSYGFGSSQWQSVASSSYAAAQVGEPRAPFRPAQTGLPWAIGTHGGEPGFGRGGASPDAEVATVVEACDRGGASPRPWEPAPPTRPPWGLESDGHPTAGQRGPAMRRAPWGLENDSVWPSDRARVLPPRSSRRPRSVLVGAGLGYAFPEEARPQGRRTFWTGTREGLLG